MAKIDREKRDKNKKDTSSRHKSSSKSNSSSSHHRHKGDHGDRKRHHRDSSESKRHRSSSSRKSSSGCSQEKSVKDKENHSLKNRQDTKDKNCQKDGPFNFTEISSNKDEKEKFISELHSKEEKSNKIKPFENDKTSKGNDSISKSSSHRHHGKSSRSHHSHRPSSSSKDKEHGRRLSSKSEKDISTTDKSSENATKESDVTKSHKSVYCKELSTASKDKDENMTKEIDSSIRTNKPKLATDTSKLKGTVIDENEITKKEVTAEDVAKAESLIKKITDIPSVVFPSEYSDYAREGSEAVPSLSSDIEKPDSQANDSYSELVSSTVTIKTPDTSGVDISSDSNPIVWKGDIHMPDVAKFSVIAKSVSGTTDYLTVDLKEALKIVGRIAPQTVWDYVSQISDSPSKEILLVRLEPTTDDEKINYTSFFEYLQHRNR